MVITSTTPPLSVSPSKWLPAIQNYLLSAIILYLWDPLKCTGQLFFIYGTLSNVRRGWLAMPLGAGVLSWVLACRTIEKKTKV